MDPGNEGQRMIRALSFAYTFPFPPHGGYDLRVVNLARHLAGKIEQTLLCRSLAPPSPAAMEASREAFAEIHALPLPRPNLARKIIRGLAFLPGPYPLAAGGFYFPSLARRLDELLSRGKPDLVVMEGSWLCPYWPLIAGRGARRVLDLHNLESETTARQAMVRESMLGGLVKRLDARRMAQVERGMIREADLVLVPSERERRALIQEDARLEVVVVPNGVDCSALRPLLRSRAGEILFVGAFTYPPNVDAAIHFADEVFPLLRREVPGVVFRLVGRSPGPEVERLGGRAGIEVTGEVEDVEPYYRRASVCVAPIRSGGGTRLKILEAMALGRPVVSTRLGCEGLDVQHDRDIVIEDDPARMAQAIRALIENGALGERIVREARALVEAKYDWGRIAEGLLEEYRRLLGSPRRQAASGN